MASLSPAYFSLYVPTPPVLTLLSSWIFFFSTLLTYFMLYLNKTLTKGNACSEFIVLSLGTKYLADVFLSCCYHWLAVDMCSYFTSRRQSLGTVDGLSYFPVFTLVHFYLVVDIFNTVSQMRKF